jgi:hypothetical protein
VSNLTAFISKLMHCCIKLNIFLFTDERCQHLLELVPNPVKKVDEPRQVPRDVLNCSRFSFRRFVCILPSSLHFSILLIPFLNLMRRFYDNG